jgi:hypothetical protein
MFLTEKGDLEHLRAVKAERHTKFAKEKGMNSYLVSARTGESVILILMNQIGFKISIN